MNDPAEVIKIIASIAHNVGWQAGVGGMETAGAIISYLAAHPDKWEAFTREGIFAFPTDFHRHGLLTWHGKDGKVHRPQDVRLQIVVNGMKPT